MLYIAITIQLWQPQLDRLHCRLPPPSITTTAGNRFCHLPSLLLQSSPALTDESRWQPRRQPSLSAAVACYQPPPSTFYYRHQYRPSTKNCLQAPYPYGLIISSTCRGCWSMSMVPLHRGISRMEEKPHSRQFLPYPLLWSLDRFWCHEAHERWWSMIIRVNIVLLPWPRAHFTINGSQHWWWLCPLTPHRIFPGLASSPACSFQAHLAEFCLLMGMEFWVPCWVRTFPHTLKRLPSFALLTSNGSRTDWHLIQTRRSALAVLFHKLTVLSSILGFRKK